MAAARGLRLDSDVELTRTFSRAQFALGLESWAWVGIGSRIPLFTSLFGDVFLESYDGFWWLDTVEGTLRKPWETVEDLNSDLRSAVGQERYLRAALTLDAELRGLVPASDEVYGFTNPPALGGRLEAGNLSVVPFTVRMHNTGQMYGWLRQAPSGSA